MDTRKKDEGMLMVKGGSEGTVTYVGDADLVGDLAELCEDAGDSDQVENLIADLERLGVLTVHTKIPTNVAIIDLDQ